MHLTSSLNFYVLPALSASSPLFDRASSHDWWLKLWVQHATWSAWILIYQANKSCFISWCPTHGQPLRISPTWFHSGLHRRTPVAFHVSHCALGIWLWSSKTSRSSRTVYQRALGAFCADLFVTDGCLLAFSGSLTRLRENHDAQL